MKLSLSKKLLLLDIDDNKGTMISDRIGKVVDETIQGVQASIMTAVMTSTIAATTAATSS